MVANAPGHHRGIRHPADCRHRPARHVASNGRVQALGHEAAIAEPDANVAGGRSHQDASTRPPRKLPKIQTPPPTSEPAMEPSATATATARPPPVPQQPATAPGGGPIDTLNRYYATFEEREPATAYRFLSAKFKSTLSYKKFSERFATTRAIRILESRIVKADARSATIAVTLEETEADSRQVQWQGPIELVREAEGWRIDTMRDLRKMIDASGNSSARTPSQSWDRPRIYVHLANDSQRPAAEVLKKRMTSAGYVVLGTDNASGNVDVPTEASELRYFTPADSGEAQRIAEELKPILGNVIASLPEGMPYVSHARQYEIWVSEAFR